MALDTKEFSVARGLWAIYSRYPAHPFVQNKVAIWAFPNCYEDDLSRSICQYYVSPRDSDENF
jgi:hypothetical protein